jgi:hypothetical protein
MMPSSYEQLDASGVRSEALTWPERAKAARVSDTVTYLTACELLKGIKALRQKIGETFDPHIKRAFEAHRALCREKADAEAPLTEAEMILKRALVAWDTEQERLRREEERRLADEARRQEEQRRLEEAAALEREAERTQDPQLREEAHALFEQPIETPTVVVAKSTPKVSGITYRELWKYRIADASKVPREYLKVDDIRIGGVVRALKGGTKIPGVEVYVEKVAAAGGGR